MSLPGNALSNLHPDSVSPAEGCRRHLPVLDVLRGFAAVWVCLFHFTRDGRTVDVLSGTAQLCAWGWLGVQMFFVISGFIIPLSMYNRSYSLCQFGGFMLRRMKRLEPPYIASILVVLSLPFIASFVPGFRGGVAEWSFPQLAAHIAYLNAVLRYEWINPVYWTLAIEFQYYICIGLVFPLISSRLPYVSSSSVMLLAAAGGLPFDSKDLLPHWLPVFAIGVCAWQVRVGLLRIAESLVTATVVVCLSAAVVGFKETAVGVGTAAVILGAGTSALPRLLRPFSLLGTISYSLYLLHEPVGNRVFNLLRRLPREWVSPETVLVSGFLCSVVASAVFWFLVEVPAQKWSAKSQMFSFSRR